MCKVGFQEVFHMTYRPYARRKKSWETPQKYHLPRFGFIFKSGNSPLENQYFSTFQIPLEPRCQHLKR